MALVWTDTLSLSQKQGVSLLVYGPAGSGKTRLVPTCPRPLLIAAERGQLSIAEHRIPTVLVKTEKDLDDLLTWARASSEAKNFDTFCLDSLTEIAEAILQEALGKNKDGRAAYGDMAAAVGKKIRQFTDTLEKHVYFSAKQEQRKTPEGGVMWAPAMPGNKAGEAQPYLYDEVFHLENFKTPENVSYSLLRTSLDISCEAKDRSGALQYWEEPHLGKIIHKIQSKANSVLQTPTPYPQQ